MNELIINEDIRNKIYSIRNMQVMLDRDLAELYDVETRVLKQAVKRNIERFPSDFMFELNDDEIEFMVSQSVIPSKQHLGGAKPFAFTEQGVSAVAAILTSKIAVEIHINIIRAFVNMRKFISTNALIFERLNSLENKQFKTDKKIETILNAIEDKSIKPKQGIFYDGQMFDAHTFVSDLIRSAKIKIILIDNYVDDSVLTLLSKNQNINVIIYTKSISKQLKLDLEKYNSQYKKIEIKKFENSHDRFMIIDDKELYHIGASLKDLGKKWFAFSKMDLKSFDVLEKLDNCRSVGI
ncbi:ORF6N domain-containing protein [Malaciobacter marinus]|uniref:ORF6N domain-containing protein n=1 Tax=Malaciobacter marinus TaxID=505249 RepID=UPI003B0036D5